MWTTGTRKDLQKLLARQYLALGLLFLAALSDANAQESQRPCWDAVKLKSGDNVLFIRNSNSTKLSLTVPAGTELSISSGVYTTKTSTNTTTIPTTDFYVRKGDGYYEIGKIPIVLGAGTRVDI